MFGTVGTVVDNRYELKKPLGIGASGEVWFARDRQVPRYVAVKLMKSGLSATEIHRERFQREIHALNELGNTHPNIPQLYSANVLASPPYFVMEYIAGSSLTEMMQDGSLYKLTFQKRLENIIRHVADALTLAHDSGIVHRDIKPDNIKILGKGEKTYLLDFSIAVMDLDATTRGIGTPRYTAPELETSQLADIFSFAVVTFEIMFGVHPVLNPADGPLKFLQAQRLMTERLHAGEWNRPADLAKQNKQLPDLDWTKIDTVFERALSVDPTQRPDNPQSLVAALEQAFDTESTSEIIAATLSSGRHRVEPKEIGAVSMRESGSVTVIEPEKIETQENVESDLEPTQKTIRPNGEQDKSYVTYSLTSQGLRQRYSIQVAIGLLVGLIIGLVIGLIL